MVAVPDAALRAILFGRTDPKGSAATSARIEDVRASAARCIETRNWPMSAPLSFKVTQTAARAPSVVISDGARWLAYEINGAIHVAKADAASADTYTETNLALVAQSDGFDAGGVRDPEWMLEAGGLSMYYTASDTSGRRSLGRVAFAGATPGVVIAREQVVDPKLLGLEEVYGASLTRAADGAWLLLSSALDARGATSLVLLRQAHGRDGRVSFDLTKHSTLISVDKRPTHSEFSALGTADLVYRHGHYQAYFSGLSAGAWVVGLLVSGDLVGWLSAGVVASVPNANSDSGGMQDPDVLVEADTLNLHYATYSVDNSSSKPTSRWQLTRIARLEQAICRAQSCAPHMDCTPVDRLPAACIPLP
jgi:hypothetical protein